MHPANAARSRLRRDSPAFSRRFPARCAIPPGYFSPPGLISIWVRPGYALYGGNPTPGGPNPMRAVLRLEARILTVHDIAAAGMRGL